MSQYDLSQNEIAKALFDDRANKDLSFQERAVIVAGTVLVDMKQNDLKGLEALAGYMKEQRLKVSEEEIRLLEACSAEKNGATEQLAHLLDTGEYIATLNEVNEAFISVYSALTKACEIVADSQKGSKGPSLFNEIGLSKFREQFEQTVGAMKINREGFEQLKTSNDRRTAEFDAAGAAPKKKAAAQKKSGPKF